MVVKWKRITEKLLFVNSYYLLSIFDVLVTLLGFMYVMLSLLIFTIYVIGGIVLFLQMSKLSGMIINFVNFPIKVWSIKTDVCRCLLYSKLEYFKCYITLPQWTVEIPFTSQTVLIECFTIMEVFCISSVIVSTTTCGSWLCEIWLVWVRNWVLMLFNCK